MKRLILCLALALSLLPDSAHAQVEMSISVGLPVAPPLVVVQPGVQVVENYDEEVFFVGGWYWCRRDDHWYRTRRPHASFVYVERGYVPTRLAYLPPPGHYRHWRREQAREDHHWWKEHDRDRRRAWKDHDQERHRAFKKHERAERHGWKAEGGHGPGPSHGGPSHGPSVIRGGNSAPNRGPSVIRGGNSDQNHGPSVIRGGNSAPGRGPSVIRGNPAPAPARGGGSAPAAGHGGRRDHGDGHGDDRHGGHGH